MKSRSKAPAPIREARAALAPDSLALALALAAHACCGVRQGRSLVDTLARANASALGVSASRETRAAAQDLAYFTMRWRARADAIAAKLLNRQPDPLVIGELLVIALALLDRARDVDAPHYTEHTLLNQTVLAAGSLAPPEAAQVLRGFANGVLRRALREKDSVFAAPSLETEAARMAYYNYPSWWIERVARAYPDAWQDVLATGQHAAPLTLRVNLRRLSIREAQRHLAEHEIESVIVSATALRLLRARRVEAIPGFQQGWYSVQDEAAQRATPLLDLVNGQRVLDACAAPGGKSGHILECADVDLVALDIDQSRLNKVSDNLARLGLSAQLLLGDANDPSTWWDGRPFDRILADLPCSASGIVRRHPDIRWLRRAADIPSLSRRQQQMLDALWRLLTPNGKLLLVTCSIFPQEGVQLASRFLSQHADARALSAPGQLLPVTTAEANHDGLYFSLIEKVA